MVLAALYEVDKFYGGQTVLQRATLELRPASRIALIGRNGSGKSTLLRLLAGLEEPDGGQVVVRDEASLAMLEQGLDPPATLTVQELCERAFEPLLELEGRLQALERAGLDDPEVYGRWEELHRRFERRGGYERRARRDMVLHALGFRGREGDSAGRLSGGEKTRLGLAQLLMAQPDVLLLDEPTNHLDMEMREWLEGYLGRYPGSAIIVSHDRAFLDAACSSTAEISRGVLRTFDGPPSSYRAAREEQERIEAATRANEQRELERLENAAAQMKLWAGQNEKLHRRAKAMEKRVERHAADMLPDALPPERSTRFTFDCDPSGEIVLQAEHLGKAFAGPLFEDVSVTVRRGERVALLGPNGAGKTTFLRLLLGDEPSDDPRGAVRYGSRVRLGYYDQELGGVDPERTLIEEMIRLVGDVEAHNLLGRFLFPYEAQYKRVADLSGGERARLALLKLTLERANLLILDEPTNHLDVEMVEALEAALAAFDGTLIVVSHDRRFVAEVANLIWEVKDGRFEAYEGDFDFYRRKRGERRAAPDGQQPRPTDGRPQGPHAKAADGRRRRQGPSRWQLERNLEELEGRIGELEGRLADAAAELARPEALTPADIARLGEEHAGLEAALLEAMAEWEGAQLALEELDAGAAKGPAAGQGNAGGGPEPAASAESAPTQRG